MTRARLPGPLGSIAADTGLDPESEPWIGETDSSTHRGARGPVGLQLNLPVFAAPNLGKTGGAKSRALIVIGTGHASIKSGVRLKSDKYFDKAALTSFGPYTKGHSVTLRHVNSAAQMKKLIESDSWDVVIYFGHGVENQQALAPKEMGKTLSKDDLVAALKTAGSKKVYLFGCKAGYTGLARAVSKELGGANVYGTFGSLDVDWEQSKDPDGTFTNRFKFKEALTEYTGGFQTEKGKKTSTRKTEMDDPIGISDDPLGETVRQ